jgi:glycerol-3-phosphate dehydrogenase
MEQFLPGCSDPTSLGKKYGASLYQAEVDYLIAKEWARTSDDILLRRTKLGLTLDEYAKQELAEYMSASAATVSLS